MFLFVVNILTHLPLDKMAAILADNIFKRIFLNENVTITIQISLKFVPRGSIRSSDNDSTGFWPPGSLHMLGADGHI